MGRKKVQDEIENLEPELEEAMEAEDLEAADDSDDETEVEAADDSDEEEVEVKKPARKPRARKPRAPKKTEEPSLLAGMSKPMEEEAAEEKSEEVVIELAAEIEEKPKASRGRKKAETKEGEEEIEAVAKPWAAVNEISASISSNLERVNQMLREIPQQELFKPAVAKPAAITKVAVGMSFFAIVLSLVSLLLSQSARQVALEQISPAAAVVHTVPTSPGEPKQLALESTPKRKLQRAPRKGFR